MRRLGWVFIAALSLSIGALLVATQCTSRLDRANTAIALAHLSTPDRDDVRPPGRESIELEAAFDPAARVAAQGISRFALPTVGVETVSSTLERPAPEPAASTIEPGTCEIRGRVVSAAGVPVSGATVVLAEFDWRGYSSQGDSVESAVDGSFAFSAEGFGYVSVFASHEAHGVAKRDRARELWQTFLELGDVALAPRGVLAGRVAGFGDEALGRCLVTANPVEVDSEFDGYETRAADDGSFRFAVLERIPYTIEVYNVPAVDERSAGVFMPDREGLVLRVSSPSALVTLSGITGSEFTDVELFADEVERVNDGWRPAKGSEVMVQRAAGRAEVFHVLFPAPGDFALEARARFEGITWRAVRRVAISAAHHEILLALAPIASQELRVEVRGSDHAPAHSWAAMFFDPMTGASSGSLSDFSSRVALPVGSWTAAVRPLEGGFVLPFTQSIDVQPGTNVLRLIAPTVGGCLTIDVEFDRGGQVSAEGTLKGPTGQSTRFSVSRSELSGSGGQRGLGWNGSQRIGPLAPGEYLVELRTRTAEVTVHANTETVLPMSLR